MAWGTLIRLFGMVIAALAGFFVLDLPGAWVGGLALGTGVTVEAIAARFMAASSVRDLLEGKGDLEARGRNVTYRDIAKFYFPLALTSFIGLSIQPLLTFFMGRSIAPLESLAVFPVVHALSFFFRSMGLALQDTAIALMGERFTHLPELKKFALGLGLATSTGLALVAFTPLSRLWFETVSGLTSELASFALTPTQVIVPLPFLAVLLSLQRAILVEGRKTHYITVASALGGWMCGGPVHSAWVPARPSRSYGGVWCFHGRTTRERQLLARTMPQCATRHARVYTERRVRPSKSGVAAKPGQSGSLVPLQNT